MRSGVSYGSNRYRKIISKYLESYDSKKESKYNILLEKNKLYGYTLSKFFLKAILNGFTLNNLNWINTRKDFVKLSVKDRWSL